MGCAQSQVDDDPAAKKNSRDIEQKLTADKRAAAKSRTLLLLGAGQSGKSTFKRQLSLLYGSGFADVQRLSYRSVIHSFVLTSLRGVALGTRRFGLPFAAESHSEILAILASPDLQSTPLTANLAPLLNAFWDDPNVKATWERVAELQVSESLEYFMNTINRICADGYVPSDQDILYSRQKTSGIAESYFEHKGIVWKVVDVGGQRSERRKWVHCFEAVTAVLFFAPLSEYNQGLEEDERVIRMLESLRLFSEVLNSHWFQDSAVILFLNKADLFKPKIEKVPLTCCFPHYTGPQEYEPALKFITEQFKSTNVKKRQLSVHVLTATDAESARHVFTAVSDHLLSQAMDIVC